MSFFEGSFRSLESEMNSRFSSLESEMNSRFDRLEVRMDRMETRMDRIGGLVNGGSRAIARLAEWSKRTDIPG
jgi:phage shock protein A